MKLTKTILSEYVIFIEKKWLENQLCGKVNFRGGKNQFIWCVFPRVVLVLGMGHWAIVYVLGQCVCSWEERSGIDCGKSGQSTGSGK